MICVGIGPGDLFEVRPDPSLVAAPKEGIPSGDIVSRMRAAIGLVDDLIERVDVRCCFCGVVLCCQCWLVIVDVAMRQDYEIPKVMATVSKPGEQPIPAPSTGAGAGAGSSGGGRGGSPPASRLPKRQSGGGGGAGTTAASTTFANVLIR